MTIAAAIAQRTGISRRSITESISLLDEGNTIPFVARYRKEVTGGLDEIALRTIEKELFSLRKLYARRSTILTTIADQGALTPALRNAIETAQTPSELEDLYRPYKPERRTRASLAESRGLGPLAASILEQSDVSPSPRELARGFLSREVVNVQEALAGAVDIAAARISENAAVRQALRKRAFRWGMLRSRKKREAEDPRGVYQAYQDFERRVNALQPHQVLAINRGEEAGILSVSILIDERDWVTVLARHYPERPKSPFSPWMLRARDEAGRRLLLPALKRDLRRRITERAQEHAITVFSANLRGLLLQPPLTGVILGIDPGYRTGCKLAVVDETGQLLETATIYPHAPQARWNEARTALRAMIRRCGVSLIAVGNGTASRETEALVAESIRSLDDVAYAMVSEDGASVYSASPLAAEEFPDLDVSIRGAVSIARRLQDPLAELVKIDPRSMGVGMYQHDLDERALADALGDVVETVVNQVGVDVNTASAALLSFVSGIGPALAKRIVAHRNVHGPFPSRRSLLNVRGLGPKAYQQAGGFLRVPGGPEPLDESAIHPESYPAAKALLERAGLTSKDTPSKREKDLTKLVNQRGAQSLCTELGIGRATLADIVEQLIRPGRDPRQSLPAPILRRDVLSIDDLRKGMALAGTVRNVVDFGAFVDIGVKQDGLLHRSQWLPGESYHVGERVEVDILNVDVERKRISLGRASSLS